MGLESRQVKLKTKFLYNEELCSSSKFLRIMDPALLSFSYSIIVISVRSINCIRVAIYQKLNAYSEFQVSSSGFWSNYKMPLLGEETELPLTSQVTKLQLQFILLPLPVNISRLCGHKCHCFLLPAPILMSSPSPLCPGKQLFSLRAECPWKLSLVA